MTKDDLLHLLLIGSDNAAAKVLARTSVARDLKASSGG